MVCFKLSHPLRIIPGRCRREDENSLVNKLNVNEEYKEAFRTESYMEICSKIEGHLERKSLDQKLSSSPSGLPLFVFLSENLLEPRQDTLSNIIDSQGYNLHPLLVDYFNITLEACQLCELLLRSIHQTRSNHRIITRIIKLSNKRSTRNGDHHIIINAMFRDLASFSLKKNPFSSISPIEIRDDQDNRNVLLHNLMSQCRKCTRKIKMTKFFNKFVGCTVVIAYTTVAITLSVLAFHTMVGIVAAPAILTCSFGFLKKQRRIFMSHPSPSNVIFKGISSNERVRAQLDVAAKGVFILINDFNTMSRLARRLNDEIEHRKDMADMCVRSGKMEVLKEVVREFRNEEECFLEQLEELEDHVYLCFLTINRSRRLVVQELMRSATIKR